MTDETGSARLLLTLPNPGPVQIQVQALPPTADPFWIWAQEISDNQTVYLLKSFTLEEEVARSVSMRAAIDDVCEVYLNGHHLGNTAGHITISSTSWSVNSSLALIRWPSRLPTSLGRLASRPYWTSKLNNASGPDHGHFLDVPFRGAGWVARYCGRYRKACSSDRPRRVGRVAPCVVQRPTVCRASYSGRGEAVQHSHGPGTTSFHRNASGP